MSTDGLAIDARRCSSLMTGGGRFAFELALGASQLDLEVSLHIRSSVSSADSALLSEQGVKLSPSRPPTGGHTIAATPWPSRGVDGLVFHDFRHIVRPSEFTRLTRLKRKFGWAIAASRSRRVIAVSAQTAKEARVHLGINDCAVIHHGNDHILRDLENHLNMGFASDALKALRSQEYIVVPGGRVNKGAQFAKELARLNFTVVLLGERPSVTDPPNVVAIGSTLSRSDYAGLLANARCLIALSTYEGFGLTPFEASALGLDCMARRSTFPCVVERNLSTMDLGDDDDLVASVERRLLNLPEGASGTQVRRWRDVAAEYLEVLGV